ncbi:MAG: reverse transcriptase domain-containing protein [Elusimicrobiota bacterium]|nr:reverse transcriptase domain-containing protein [Elusimicrobiota bacterium]
MENGLFSFSNIHRCYLKCRRNKRNTINALRFEINLEENLCLLERELKTKSYQPARSVCFVVKKPKLREIFAADFKDRVVHHILVDYLERLFEPKFIFDSYACRTGKGTHKAVERLRKFSRQVTANDTKSAFYLQMDLRSYFVSIDKGILLNLIRRATSNPDVLWLAETIVNNDCAGNFVIKGNPGLISLLPPHKTLFKAPKNCGLPIGNLTSQFFANVYLNEMDQFIKRDLKVKHYIRYVDDFILPSEDREQLAAWRGKIAEFVREKLKLAIHPQKQRIAPVSDGMDFLGYIVRPGYILARKRVVRNFNNKMREIAGTAVKGGVLEFQPALVKKANAIANSYLAHFNRANSYRLKNALAARYGFLKEFGRASRLVTPHYFPSLAKQYKFFKKALSGAELYWDENGQLCFRDRAALVFFPVGRSYAFFGPDAVAAAGVLGVKFMINGGVPLSVSREIGPERAVFSAALEKKYADMAVSKGYTVYVAAEKKDMKFDHKLLPRVLLKYIPAGGAALC